MTTSKIDPMTYGKMDWITLAIQILAAGAAVYFGMNGHDAAWLGLAGLAGGAKGALVSDVIALISKHFPKKLILVLFAGSVLFAGCGTGITSRFLIDSKGAALAVADDYLGNCQAVLIAPGFTVDWNENVTFGGTIFAGCPENDQLVELRCVGVKDETTGKTKIECQSLALWALVNEG